MSKNMERAMGLIGFFDVGVENNVEPAMELKVWRTY